jgi:hypothetical protein
MRKAIPVISHERDVLATSDAREAALDRALEATFPASDPISSQVPSTVERQL